MAGPEGIAPIPRWATHRRVNGPGRLLSMSSRHPRRPPTALCWRADRRLVGRLEHARVRSQGRGAWCAAFVAWRWLRGEGMYRILSVEPATRTALGGDGHESARFVYSDGLLVACSSIGACPSGYCGMPDCDAAGLGYEKCYGEGGQTFVSACEAEDDAGVCSRADYWACYTDYECQDTNDLATIQLINDCLKANAQCR